MDHAHFHGHFPLHFSLSVFPSFSLYPPMSYSIQHLKEAAEILALIDPAGCERCVAELRGVRDRGGRLFILGVGGSAANASHAVNDFRKIAGIECYAPTDNVSELTARTNDEGWASVFSEWLRGSRLNADDGLLVLSVGGGNLEKNVSPNLVLALQLAKQVGARIIGLVGRDGGYTAKVADACVIVPTVNPDNVTPHTEAFQAVLWHLFVSHPDLKLNRTKWESFSPVAKS
jgi:D-sedoheptulose 7-phosphate isomerase